jgi:hypothetical protein
MQGHYQRSNDREADPPLSAAQRNARELSRDEEAYFSEAAGTGPCHIPQSFPYTALSTLKLCMRFDGTHASHAVLKWLKCSMY